MTADHLKGLEEFEAELWKIADNLRANSNLASNERHTFCSHLSMRGAPARAIQELAGHKDLSTTQRYMHLSPSAIENAIRLLDTPTALAARGDIVETAIV